VPVLPVDYETLSRLIGRRIPRDELIARVPMMGGAYDGEKDGKLLFEFFPNRPDLLSVEGLARACRAFFDVEPGLKPYPVTPSGDEVHVESSVTKVRPHIGFARVEGVHVDDALLVELIDVQERLTTGPGRRRKKVAIGIHDAAPVKGPYHYKAVKADEVHFVPLQMEAPLTPREILEQHEKGRLYRHLVDEKRIPLIVDRDGQVLSMPPVINGQLTALTTRTRDVLIDVTGTDERATLGLLAIVATSLAERGGRIRSLEVLRGKTRTTTPNLEPARTSLALSRVKELLGITPTPDELQRYLGRMGHGVEATTARSATVASPAWRLDLLHADDLVEDVGVGHGFDKFKPRLPAVAQFGGIHATAQTRRRARTLLLGLGFTEVMTLTVTSRGDALDAIGAANTSTVEIANPVTLEHAILRPHLFTSLLGILRANKHRELPQSVFEVSFVLPTAEGNPPPNELRAAALRIAPRAPFAECKGLVESFLRDLGRAATIEAGAVPGFIPGRCARLVEDGKAVGFFGEVHPETIGAFDLGAPILGFEVVL